MVALRVPKLRFIRLQIVLIDLFQDGRKNDFVFVSGRILEITVDQSTGFELHVPLSTRFQCCQHHRCRCRAAAALSAARHLRFANMLAVLSEPHVKVVHTHRHTNDLLKSSLDRRPRPPHVRA